MPLRVGSPFLSKQVRFCSVFVFLVRVFLLGSLFSSLALAEPGELPPKPPDEATQLKALRENMLKEEEKRKGTKPAGEVSEGVASPETLKPFGYDFFQGAMPPRPDGKEESRRSLSVPRSYALDIGDDLKVIIMAESGRETQSETSVNAEGNIYIPGLGLMNVVGMTIGDLENAISSRLFQRFGRRLKAFVTVSRIHAIQVYVVGEAVRPGTLVLSGLATPLDALYAAGGPNVHGSMRDIRVIRQNRVAARIDFYRYLLKGEIVPLGLQSGDTILIPPKSRAVGITGEVLRPALYELAKNETLQDLLELAGGALPSSYAARVRIDRIVEGEKREILDAGLKEASVRLLAGDMVTVYSVLPEITNAVTVQGVRRPGAYGYRPGMKVSDLIRLGQGFGVEMYTGKADIFRQKSDKTKRILTFDLGEVLKGSPSDDLPLLPGDLVVFYPASAVTYQERMVSVRGAVVRPESYQRVEQMTVRDLVLSAGGLVPEASMDAELARVVEGKVKVYPVNLREVLEKPDSSANLVLQDRDTLYIKSIAGFHRWAGSVTLRGEVMHPGDYPILDEQDTLAKVLARAGGLTDRAFPYGAVFVRQTGNIAETEQIAAAQGIQDYAQQIAEQLTRLEVARQAAENGPSAGYAKVHRDQTTGDTTVSGLATTPSGVQPSVVTSGTTGSTFGGVSAPVIQQPTTVTLPSSNEFVRKLRGILNTGRIPVDLDQAMRSPNKFDVTLREGDVLYIPAKPSTVIVAGAAYAPSALLYQEGSHLGDYLARAGGLAPDADDRHLLVVHANGETVPASRGSRIQLGDIILVPTKALRIEKTGWERFTDLLRVIITGVTLQQLFK